MREPFPVRLKRRGVVLSVRCYSGKKRPTWMERPDRPMDGWMVNLFNFIFPFEGREVGFLSLHVSIHFIFITLICK